VILDAAESQRYVKAISLGCSNISQMDVDVTNIVLQELRQLCVHR